MTIVGAKSWDGLEHPACILVLAHVRRSMLEAGKREYGS